MPGPHAQSVQAAVQERGLDYCVRRQLGRHMASSLYAIVVMAGITLVAAWTQVHVVSAQPTSTALRDDQFEVVSFEDLKYPRVVSSARIQGLVVIEVSFDDSGNVVSASPLSGPPALYAPAVDNVKKWKFRANGSGEKRVLIGYDFSLDPAPCKSGDTLFVLRHKNLASITTCNDLWNTH